MNFIDIIIILLLLWALYSGYKKGIVPQVGILVGLTVGVFLSYYLGEAVHSWMNITNPAGKVVAYVVVAGIALFAVILAARMISNALSIAGLGIMDQILGALLSLVKVVVIISILLCGFDWLNNKKEIVKEHTLKESLLYYPTISLTSYAFPFVEEARKKIEQLDEQDDKRVNGKETQEQGNGN